MSKRVKEAIRIIQELNINRISQDVVFSVTHYNCVEDMTSIQPAIDSIFSDLDAYSSLLDHLRYIRDHKLAKSFWDSLTKNDISPNVFIPLCFKLIPKTGKIAMLTSCIYVTLLGIQPLHFTYHLSLIQLLLKHMVRGIQGLETKKLLTEKEENCIFISSDIMKELSFSLSKELFETATVEVFGAFTEMSFKFGSYSTKEILRLVPSLMDNALLFIKSAFLISYEHVLPYLVSAILSDAYAHSFSKFKESVVQIASDALKEHDSQILLVCQHLIVRCSDKIGIKESVSSSIHHFFQLFIDNQPFLDFLVTCTMNNKSTLRAISCDVIRCILSQHQHINGKKEKDLITAVIKLAKDTALSVRAAALLALISIAEKKKTWEEVQKKMDFESILQYRLRDEKVTVRRNAMKLLKTAIYRSSEFNPVLLKFVAERTNDVNISIRQEAMQSLSYYFSEFQSDSVFSEWLDCILPKILELDPRLVASCAKLVESDFLSNVEKLWHFSNILTQDHIALLKHVFQYLYNNDNTLKPLAYVLKKHLATVADEDEIEEENDPLKYPNMWFIADALCEVIIPHSNTFKHFVADLWDYKEKLPFAYLSMVYQVALKIRKKKTQDPEEIKFNEMWIHDSLNILRDVSKNKAHPQIQFGHIHYLCLICLSDDDSFFHEIMETSIKTISSIRNVNNEDQHNLSCLIYMIGEIIYMTKYIYIDPRILLDLSFTETYPLLIRNISILSLGKLCLLHKDLAHTVIIRFAGDLLIDTVPDSIKANEMTCLCDLCVCYTAMVDPYIDNIMACLIKGSPIVRRHALIAITRLITQDYIKFKPHIFYRYISLLIHDEKAPQQHKSSDITNTTTTTSGITSTSSDDLSSYDPWKLSSDDEFPHPSIPLSDDEDEDDFSSFVATCLFDVLIPKYPKVILSLADSFLYFAEDDKKDEISKLFDVPPEKRRMMYQLVLSRMNESQLFDFIRRLLIAYIDPIILEDATIQRSNLLIKDVLLAIGDAYQIITSNKAINILPPTITSNSSSSIFNTTDKNTQNGTQNTTNSQTNDEIQRQLIDENDPNYIASRKIMDILHKAIVQKLLPQLIQFNKILARSRSPLQTDLTRLLALIVSKDRSLLEEIEVIDHILAVEIKNTQIQEEEIEESIPPSPIMRRMFSSHLLSRLASRDFRRSETPTSQIQSQDDLPIFDKRPPPKFDSDDD